MGLYGTVPREGTIKRRIWNGLVGVDTGITIFGLFVFHLPMVIIARIGFILLWSAIFAVPAAIVGYFLTPILVGILGAENLLFLMYIWPITFYFCTVVLRIMNSLWNAFTSWLKDEFDLFDFLDNVIDAFFWRWNKGRCPRLWYSIWGSDHHYRYPWFLFSKKATEVERWAS